MQKLIRSKQRIDYEQVAGQLRQDPGVQRPGQEVTEGALDRLYDPSNKYIFSYVL